MLLPREGDPVLWDFGSAARHHQLYAPWLLAGHIHQELREHGLEREPLGIDLTDMETLASLQRWKSPRRMPLR